MNILFLTPRDSKTNLGGVERHVKLLAEELGRRGHEVKELSLDEVNKSYKGYKNYKEEKKGEKEHPPKAEAFRRAGKDKKEKGKSQKDRKVGKFRAWRYLWEKRELLRWAEVIHVHDVFWWVMPFLPMIRWNKGYKDYKSYKGYKRDCHGPPAAGLAMTKTKVFVTFHGWEGRWPPTRSAVWQKRLAAFLSDGTIGVGGFFEKWYGVKTDRVVWGVLDKNYKSYKEYKSFKESPCHTARRHLKRRGHPIFAFFGRLEEVNGIEIVIEAAERLNKSYKDYKNYKDRTGRHLETSSRSHPVLFVGDGTFRKQAERVGRVTGMVKNPWRYLVGAEAVIASSYLAILEAAALGKRIIAVANNPLKLDYLEGHPLRGYFKVVGSAEELVGEIRDKSYKDYKDYKGNSWAMGQTAEKLGDEYLELWSRK